MNSDNGMPSHPALSDIALEPGDVLLLRSQGPLSDLIAWLSGSAYSHAELYIGGGVLVEALAGQGVTYTKLEERLDTDTVSRIDAYHNNCLVDGNDRASVVAKAKAMVGQHYALDQLVLVGLLMLVEDRQSAHPLLRWVAAAALRHLIEKNSDGVLCSELVYRCFAEADAQPAGRLAPAITLPRPTNTTPFPRDFDWAGLIRQIQHLITPASPPRLAAILVAASVTDPVAAALADLPDADTLTSLRETALDQLGLDVPHGREGLLMAASPGVDARLVAPQDFAVSPDMHVLGTLLDRTTAPPTSVASGEPEPA